LHCRQMELIHPVRLEPVTVVADTPETEIWRLAHL
jgi:hypothetical protein